MATADLITIAVFVGALLCLACVGLVMGGAAGKRRAARVEGLRRKWAVAADAADENASLLRGGEESRFGAALLRVMPRSHMLRHRLAKAGVSLSPGRYALINLVVGVIVGSAARWGFHMPVLFAGLIGVAGGLGLPHLMIARLTDKRLKRFGQLFPEAIDLMVRGIRSGLPITETIASIGQELADPVGPEFRRIADAVKLGQPFEEALWDVASRLDTAEFKFFVISLSVQRETGGNLAETLENLSDVLRKRLQMRMKIKAMSSEAKASAYIIGSLPFIMFGILLLMNPDYILTLFTDPRGMMLVGSGLGTIFIGALVMAKMVKFEI